jgi:dTDP-4-amino-4,6-dideoxygalactose transaminase
MTVPFLDAGAAYTELRAEIDAAIAAVLSSGNYILGPEVEAFEVEYARYCGATCCVAVGNGLDALRIALSAGGVQPGDEVIVPAQTFVATWMAVSQVGATPVPVDVGEDAPNIDVSRVEAAITPRTRAIVPVHLFGFPADLTELESIAERRQLLLVQDAAQAHGATRQGQRVGARGTAAFSFYPAKNLGALGDAGAITTDDPDLADRARLLRNYGSRSKYLHEIVGQNSRLDPLQAAVLRVKLRHLDRWNERRRNVAIEYFEQLRDTSLKLPVMDPGVEPSWHLFAVRSSRRDELQRWLATHGISTQVHYPTPPHLQPAYSDHADASFPNAQRWARTALSLPMGPHLPAEQVAEVVEAVRAYEAIP